MAAGDGAVAWGVDARHFMCRLLRELDHVRASVLLERAWRGHATDDVLQRATAGVIRLATQVAFVIQIFVALKACDVASVALQIKNRKTKVYKCY